METIDLQFIKENDLWVCRMTSPGRFVLQVERESNRFFSVWANLPDMEPMLIHEHGASYSISKDNAIHTFDIPAGVEVVIKSRSKVNKAKIMIVDE